MKIAALEITPQFLVELGRFCKSGPTRRVIIKENPLPVDAEVVEVQPYTFAHARTVRLIIKSEEFAEIQGGQEIPNLPPVVFETLYEEDRCSSCGIDFSEFPDMRHTEEECGGPECTCYEVIGGHQMGCYFYGKREVLPS